MPTAVQLYLISVPVFFVIDMLWLGLIASSFYRNQLGDLLEIRWVPAVVFYLVYLVGLTYFATYPAWQQQSLMTALTLGALFGFFTYATYDMTNLATVKDWPLTVVVVDIVWGTVLGASVAAGTYYLYNLFA